MHLKSILLSAMATVLVLAAPRSGTPGLLIELRTGNSAVEITGGESDRVQVEDPSRATVISREDRVVVEGNHTGGGTPLRVRVPRGAALDVVTSNGAIHVSGVLGEMDLATTNAAIMVRNAGVAGIHAVTCNGAIDLGVTGSLNANLSAHTSNGAVHADVPLVASRMGETYLEGKIGAGGVAIDLQTSNGSISLKDDGQMEKVTSVFKSDEVK